MNVALIRLRCGCRPSGWEILNVYWKFDCLASRGSAMEIDQFVAQVIKTHHSTTTMTAGPGLRISKRRTLPNLIGMTRDAYPESWVNNQNVRKLERFSTEVSHSAFSLRVQILFLFRRIKLSNGYCFITFSRDSVILRRDLLNRIGLKPRKSIVLPPVDTAGRRCHNQCRWMWRADPPCGGCRWENPVRPEGLWCQLMAFDITSEISISCRPPRATRACYSRKMGSASRNVFCLLCIRFNLGFLFCDKPVQTNFPTSCISPARCAVSLIPGSFEYARILQPYATARSAAQVFGFITVPRQPARQQFLASGHGNRLQ